MSKMQKISPPTSKMRKWGYHLLKGILEILDAKAVLRENAKYVNIHLDETKGFVTEH